MRRILTSTIVLLGFVLSSLPAAGQTAYRPYGLADPATGETYNVELAGGWWFPTPALTISSESLGIAGTTIDGVADLGFEKSKFSDVRLVLRPARKHKFLFGYMPAKYEADTILRRDIIFNGILFQIGIPIQASLTWKAYNVAYEYDFLYRDRWFVGFMIGADWTQIEATLDAPIDHEYASAQAPIPLIGGIARVYVVPNISVTGKVTGFKLPSSIGTKDIGTLKTLDVDVYGTVNFTEHFGVQGGYRAYHVTYAIEKDSGDLKLDGLYIRGVARF